MPPFRRIAIALCALAVSAPSALLAQANTGRIAGVVQDEKGAPLPHTNVIIVELGEGRIANESGRVTFEDVPAGTYTLTADRISYEKGRQTGVVVQPGQTTRLEFKLKEAIAAELEVIKIQDKFERLQKDRSETIRRIDSRDVQKIRAINTTEEAIATQAGVTQLGDEFFIRGGRSGEVKTLVDGMPVSDAFAGSQGSGTLSISLMSQEGMNVLTGGFDAEYGNAQSGIIEIATREGGEKYEGQLRFMTDDFGAPDKTYFNYDNFGVAVGGPVPSVGNRVRFYLSGEVRFEDTYLKTLENRSATKLTLNGNEIASFRPRQRNHAEGQARLTFHLGGGGRKLNAEYLLSRDSRDWYHHAFSRVGFWSEEDEQWWYEKIDSTYTYYNGPEHVSEIEAKNDNYKLVYTHPLGADSFVKTRVGMLRTRYNESVDGKSPSQYVPFFGSDPERDPENLFYAIQGDYPEWEERDSRQYTLRTDYQNKLGGGTHDVKTGINLDYHDLRRDERRFPSEEDPEGQFPNQYDVNAVGGFAYVQDRLRYRKTLVINVGLRLDFFDPGQEAIRATNQRVLTLEKPTSGTSFFERWKAQISPRLGMSYPISDKDVLRFHYGRFFQLPELRYIYDFIERTARLAGNQQRTGNAFLEPETTISYEFGVRRQLSDRDLSRTRRVFFKDIFGLIGTEGAGGRSARPRTGGVRADLAYFNQGLRLRPRVRVLAIDKKILELLAGRRVVHAVEGVRARPPTSIRARWSPQEGLDREPIKRGSARLGSNSRLQRVSLSRRPGSLGCELRLLGRLRGPGHSGAPRPADGAGGGHQHDPAAGHDEPQPARQQAVLAVRSGVPDLPGGEKRPEPPERANGPAEHQSAAEPRVLRGVLHRGRSARRRVQPEGHDRHHGRHSDSSERSPGL